MAPPGRSGRPQPPAPTSPSSRGDDVLPRRAIERGVSSLEISGSDLAVGRLDVAEPLHPSVFAPYDPAHAQTRIGTTLAEFPMAITDVSLGNRLFRTSFWRAAGLSFPDVADGDADLALAAYTHATRFDILNKGTYVWMNRGRGTPLEQIYDTMADLDGWLAGQRTTFAHLAELEDPALHNAWIFGVLDKEIIRFVDDTERADDGQWAALRGYVQELADAMDDAVWAQVRAEHRVKLWLVLHDRRADLEDLVASRWFEQGNRPTEVRDGRIYAAVGGYRDPDAGIPDEWFELHEAETPLRTMVRGARWSGAETLELDLLTYIELVRYDAAPDVEVVLVEPTTGQRVELATRARLDEQANLSVGHAYQDYRLGGLTVVVDAAQLAAVSPQPTGPLETRVRWRLELTVRDRGLTRTGTITDRDERGSIGMLSSPHLARRQIAGRRVNVAADVETGIRIEVGEPDPVTLLTGHVEGRSVLGTLRGPAGLVRMTARRPNGTMVRTDLVTDGDGYRFRLDLPASETQVPGGWMWQLRALRADGEQLPIAWPDGETSLWLPGPPDASLAVARTALGRVELLETADTLVLDAVDLADGGIRATGRWLGAAPKRARLTLVGPRATQEADLRLDGEVAEALVPTTCDEWGLGTASIPGGQYLFRLVAGSTARPGRVLLTDRLVDELLTFRVDDDFRLRAIRTGRGEAGVFLAPPLGPEEWGPYAQRQLQEWLRTTDDPIDQHAVYLQSYAGATATDSQLAIHEELRRTHPELTLYWGVLDHASRVPEGAVPVVMRTREWYRVLATSRYLVNNIDFDRWFAKREGQSILQTFHGYPAKSMGIRMWVAKNFSPRRVQLEIDRTSRDWDLILTPAPEMDAYYRREYRYDGAIHSSGYPRDDVLVSADAERIRKETRDRLGIADGQTAVLYAPTWRDNQATNYRSAKLVRHLDLESASGHLGPEYVLLMRGHRFHAKGAERSERTARLIDVTDYPEVNDLILASDTAVLDYSSLRFDFALTGRPMVFLVPDLASYTGGIRGFLYDYADTAPGPMLDTADEVIEVLRDVPALREAYADRMSAFNQKYNYLQDGRSAERVVRAFWG